MQQFKINGRLAGYNQLHTGHWAVCHDRKKTDMILIQVEAMRQKIRPITGRCKITICCYEPNGKRDVDNVKSGAAKLILDALQGIRVLKNDNRKYVADVIMPAVQIDKQYPRVEVCIEEIEE